MANYYVDSNAVSDGDGTYATPWKYIATAQAALTGDQSGNSLLLKCDSVFREALVPTAYGTIGNPFTVGQYGTGDDPILVPSKFFDNGTSWTGPDGNGEYYLAVGLTTEFLSNSTLAIRGQPTGMATYIPVAHGVKGSLIEDSFDFYVNGANLEVWYKPIAGHTPDEYEWEFPTKAVPLYINNLDYVTVDGITVIGGARQATPNIGGIAIHDSDYFIIQNCLSYCGLFGIILSNSGHGSILNTTVRNSRNTGIWVEEANSHYVLIQDCSVYNNSLVNGSYDQGFDRGGIMFNYYTTNLTVNRCIIGNNGCNSTIRLNSEVLLDGTDYATITNNYIYDCWRRAIGMSATEPGTHHVITGNIINRWGLGNNTYPYGCAIFMVGIGDTDNGYHLVANNTIFTRDDLQLIGLQISSSTSLRLKNSSIKNNIVYFTNNTQEDSIGLRIGSSFFAGTTFDYNLIYGITNLYEYNGTPYTSAAAFAAATDYGDHDLDDDPQFANAGGSYALDTDFKLQADSPCINAGTDVGLTTDYEGNPIAGLPDIGAYEYQPTTPLLIGNMGVRII